jgi:AraC-like DNA-binding protein
MLLLTKYLDEIGAGCVVATPDPGAARSLPVFITQAYEPHRANLFGREYSLLVCRGGKGPTPAEAEKHLRLVRSVLGGDVAFVLLALPTFDRKRFIQRRIPFLVPGRQAYLPVSLIDLRENAKGGPRLLGEPKERLSAPAQLLVLYHLQAKADSQEWPLNQWADSLGYSRSTLTRVYREVAAVGLCRPATRGRNVTLDFPSKRRELWNAALPHLGSPVRSRLWVKILDRELPLHEAGVTALARLTMLSPEREQVYAISSVAFEAAREDRRLVPIEYPEDGTVRIERWKYAPGLLSPDSRVVDRLSLYLSMQDDQDERIQAALAELMEQMEW